MTGYGAGRPVPSTRRLQDASSIKPENPMANGHANGNREAKKPKGEKPKGEASAYKQSQGKSGQVSSPPAKKS